MAYIIPMIFVLAALVAAGGIFILVILSPRPTRLEDHMLGLARYLMFAGAVFGAAAAVSGWQPRWHQVLFMVGFGLGMAIFARRNHLLALASERLSDDGQESGC